MSNRVMLATLQCLFEMARDDQPAELTAVAAELGLRCSELDRVLNALERADLVDAERLRLTMAGLAVAASLPAQLIETRAAAA